MISKSCNIFFQKYLQYKIKVVLLQMKQTCNEYKLVKQNGVEILTRLNKNDEKLFNKYKQKIKY